jgi:hypothetical protein
MSCVPKNVSTIRKRADKVPFMTCCNSPYDLFFFLGSNGGVHRIRAKLVPHEGPVRHPLNFHEVRIIYIRKPWR